MGWNRFGYFKMIFHGELGENVELSKAWRVSKLGHIHLNVFRGKDGAGARAAGGNLQSRGDRGTPAIKKTSWYPKPCSCLTTLRYSKLAGNGNPLYKWRFRWENDHTKMMEFPASPVWLLDGQLIFPELGDSWVMGRASNVHWMTRLRWSVPNFQVICPKKNGVQSRWPWKDSRCGYFQKMIWLWVKTLVPKYPKIAGW